jgi:phosphoadenosine phosphosulfate reductase
MEFKLCYNHVERAIQCLRLFEPPEGYYLAFSGGKDSECIKRLARMSGVKFDAHYNVTTVDPPELIRHMLKHHRDVVWEHSGTNMADLIVKKGMPPLRNMRYCCSVFKERGGEGRRVMTGVRWAESPRRRKHRRQCEKWDIKTLINPIIDWTDTDVWEFIRGEKIKYCELYDKGHRRLGCVGCPNGHPKKDFSKWPRFERYYLKAFDRVLRKQRDAGLKPRWTDAHQMLNWWLGDIKKQRDDECSLF